MLLLRPAAGFTRALFVTGPGPLSGGSNGGKVKWPHIPEKSGIGAVCAPSAAQGKIAIDTNPTTAHEKYLPEKARMRRLRIRDRADATELNPLRL
jgi:hypothetical protein